MLSSAFILLASALSLFASLLCLKPHVDRRFLIRSLFGINPGGLVETFRVDPNELGLWVLLLASTFGFFGSLSLI